MEENAMMAVLFLIASFLVGAVLILTLKPAWENRLHFFLCDKHTFNPGFLFFPASYLIGTLVLSWITYILAVAFQSTEKPLLFSNLASFLLTIAFVAFAVLMNRLKIIGWLNEVKKHGSPIRFSSSEWLVLIGSAVFWSIFIFRSLYMDGELLHAGFSAFSDFGAHLPVVRSFSYGNNFPALYPHFPDGAMRYHFMFYFMSGNLEYLGFNLPWALNLPSILSLVSFSMLLYGLAVGITNKPLAGLFTCLLFAFRSSFAFFTYSKDFSSLNSFMKGIANNLNADGSSREHIGNTVNESWGLWTQKVYMNQRHLAFAFGLFILVLFLVLPLFIETIERLKTSMKANANTSDTLKKYFKNLFFVRDAWLPRSFLPCVLAGLILGLMAFWNGAVVIAGISVLFIMAILSCHKLEYLITAILTFLLSVLQSKIFIGSGTGAVSIKYEPGFLAQSDKLTDILAYYVELLGILPFVVLAVFLVFIPGKKKWLSYSAAILFTLLLVRFIPSIGLVPVILITSLCALLFLFIIRSQKHPLQPSSPWLIPVFLGPILLASTLQLTPDITVNHKYIILAVALLNIPVSDLLTALFQSHKKTARLISLVLIMFLICTGIVDLITLYNLDKNSVIYNQQDPVQLWVHNETNPDDIFLTHYMTHYGAPMSIMLAGRSVYSGYPYFTVTAGYDVAHRENIMKTIYGIGYPDELRTQAIAEGIDYIVIEDQNRSAGEYTLNEAVFYNTFPVAYEDTERNIVIFRVQ
jgi:hypothetical protein